jgi:hypothetical protein
MMMARDRRSSRWRIIAPAWLPVMADRDEVIALGSRLPELPSAKRSELFERLYQRTYR